jgi:hypothetical protein
VALRHEIGEHIEDLLPPVTKWFLLTFRDS